VALPPFPAVERPAPSTGAPLLSQTDVGARLLCRLDAARARPTRQTMAALRASVTELVDRMRALDPPRERVLATLETLLREHGVAHPPAAAADDQPARTEAVTRGRLLEWCARAYENDDWW
jgi:hypothetical protein